MKNVSVMGGKLGWMAVVCLMALLSWSGCRTGGGDNQEGGFTLKLVAPETASIGQWVSLGFNKPEFVLSAEWSVTDPLGHDVTQYCERRAGDPGVRCLFQVGGEYTFRVTIRERGGSEAYVLGGKVIVLGNGQAPLIVMTMRQDGRRAVVGTLPEVESGVPMFNMESDVEFDFSGTSDLESDFSQLTFKVSYEGDGEPVEVGKISSHRYPRAGMFPVKLEVLDSDSNKRVKMFSIFIACGNAEQSVMIDPAGITVSPSPSDDNNGYRIDAAAGILLGGNTEGKAPITKWDVDGDGVFDTDYISQSSWQGYVARVGDVPITLRAIHPVCFSVAEATFTKFFPTKTVQVIDRDFDESKLSGYSFVQLTSQGKIAGGIPNEGVAENGQFIYSRNASTPKAPTGPYLSCGLSNASGQPPQLNENAQVLRATLAGAIQYRNTQKYHGLNKLVFDVLYSPAKGQTGEFSSSDVLAKEAEFETDDDPDGVSGRTYRMDFGQPCDIRSKFVREAVQGSEGPCLPVGGGSYGQTVNTFVYHKFTGSCRELVSTPKPGQSETRIGLTEIAGLCLIGSGTLIKDCVPPVACNNGKVEEGEICDPPGSVLGDGRVCGLDCTSASTCGDGKKEGVEQCDEGSSNSNTGSCTLNCKLPFCGDGFLQTGNGEVCEPPGSFNNGLVCNGDCKAEHAPVCGDGNREGNEACDPPGSLIGGGICKSDCSGARPIVCGDGVREGYEQCDEGPNNSDTGTCKLNCTLPYCGDGIKQDSEQCDPPGHVEAGGQICNSNCGGTHAAVCGDGVREGSEICDPPGAWVGGKICEAGCLTSHSPVCGDGIKEGNEQCDEGAGNSDTGTCKANCTLPYCGDGIRQGAEQCDGEPNCSAQCRFLPVCGNGVIESGEQCDDGNVVSGDGCSATCKSES